MVNRKKSIKKTTSSDELDNLYIAMHNSTEKRKNILYSIKNSLVMQDEYEKVFNIRKNKGLILNEIKKELSSLNSNYQKLKKLLPNVKNVISYTEKELEVLDRSIDSLRNDISSDRETISLDENLKESIKSGTPLIKAKENIIKAKEESIKKPVKKTTKKKTEKLTKLDRIKNNLKVIESKLNSL